MFRKTLFTIAAVAVLAGFSSQLIAGSPYNALTLNALTANANWGNAMTYNALTGNALGSNAAGRNGAQLYGLSLGGSDGIKVISIELPR